MNDIVTMAVKQAEVVEDVVSVVAIIVVDFKHIVGEAIQSAHIGRIAVF